MQHVEVHPVIFIRTVIQKLEASLWFFIRNTNNAETWEHDKVIHLNFE